MNNVTWREAWDEYCATVLASQELPDGSDQQRDAQARACHLADTIGLNGPEAA